MWKKFLVLLLFAVIGINSMSAQKRHSGKIEITGKVQDVYNSPIANAILMVDGKKTNETTNSKGYYRLKVKSSAARLGVFTFSNGVSETPIDGRKKIDFNFSKPASATATFFTDGEQGVYTGYGHVKKKNLVTDVSRIDGMNDKYASYSSISEMIEREVSGVLVRDKQVLIQGSRNIYGDVHPLIVLDGVYLDKLPDIPPVTVKSIEVLKSTAGAIYGYRSYGGVIVIKTKIQNN
jgi:hypothetical protein